MHMHRELVQVGLGFAAGIVGLRVGEVVAQFYIQLCQFIRIGFRLFFQELFKLLPLIRIFPYKSDFSHQGEFICGGFS